MEYIERLLNNFSQEDANDRELIALKVERLQAIIEKKTRTYEERTTILKSKIHELEETLKAEREEKELKELELNHWFEKDALLKTLRQVKKEKKVFWHGCRRLISDNKHKKASIKELKTQLNEFYQQAMDIEEMEKEWETKENEWKIREVEWKTEENKWKTKEKEWITKDIEWKVEEMVWKTKKNEWKTKKNEWKTKENEWKTKIAELEKIQIKHEEFEAQRMQKMEKMENESKAQTKEWENAKKLFEKEVEALREELEHAHSDNRVHEDITEDLENKLEWQQEKVQHLDRFRIYQTEQIGVLNEELRKAAGTAAENQNHMDRLQAKNKQLEGKISEYEKSLEAAANYEATQRAEEEEAWEFVTNAVDEFVLTETIEEIAASEAAGGSVKEEGR